MDQILTLRRYLNKNHIVDNILLLEILGNQDKIALWYFNLLMH